MRTFFTLAALASCIIPAIAQSCSNCDIVSNVTVKSGDTLNAIATANGVTLEQILFVNPSITNANLIFPGEVIAIPDSSCVPTTTEPPPPAPCSRPKTYTVVSGDTLSTIADKFGVTLEALEAANPQIKNPDFINVGQVLNIPPCPTTTTTTTTTATQKPETCSRPKTYTVVSGDTLSAIAGKFGVTLEDLEAANPQITNPNLIQIGQVINIPACPTSTTNPTATPKPVTCSRPKTYTVVSGDTLSAIAAKFGVTLEALEAANPQITNPNLIQIGQVINVPACPTANTATTTGATGTSSTSTFTATCSTGTVSKYTVVSGDTLTAIATEKFGITLAALEAANPDIKNPDLIFVGQVINIPLCAKTSSKVKARSGMVPRVVVF